MFPLSAPVAADFTGNNHGVKYFAVMAVWLQAPEWMLNLTKQE